MVLLRQAQQRRGVRALIPALAVAGVALGLVLARFVVWQVELSDTLIVAQAAPAAPPPRQLHPLQVDPNRPLGEQMRQMQEQLAKALGEALRELERQANPRMPSRSSILAVYLLDLLACIALTGTCALLCQRFPQSKQTLAP